MITFEFHDHELSAPFRIAHGDSERRTTLIARFGDGIGEGAIVPYYPETRESVDAWLKTFDASAFDPALTLEALLALIPGDAPLTAACAMDLAIHDHCAIRAGLPLGEFLKLPAGASRLVRTLSNPVDGAELAVALDEIRGTQFDLKLKLGGEDFEHDLVMFQMAQTLWPHPVAIDANGGWTPAMASEFLSCTRDNAALFIEEPVRGIEAWRELKRMLPALHPSLFADETVQTIADVAALASSVDGVNVKLLKTRGLRGAVDMISRARAAGLQIMIGTMLETSVGCTAAAHLAGLAKVVDLDGYVFLKDDPFVGLDLDRGLLKMPNRPGIGAIARK
jgi:L-alanine-DL-glutamate epimerase-like enolase superfamily enzyme